MGIWNKYKTVSHMSQDLSPCLVAGRMCEALAILYWPDNFLLTLMQTGLILKLFHLYCFAENYRSSQDCEFAINKVISQKGYLLRFSKLEDLTKMTLAMLQLVHNSNEVCLLLLLEPGHLTMIGKSITYIHILSPFLWPLNSKKLKTIGSSCFLPPNTALKTV